MTRGITAYAAYLPRHRLQREELGTALGGKAGKGARIVAGFDEDTTTMGLEAARMALADSGEVPGKIFLATTAPVYADKTNAAAIHAALDLRHEGFAVDMAGSARSGTGALRTAAATGGMAILSDLRTGFAGSVDESQGADAAVAFLFGEGEPIAEFVSEASATAEFLDRWRDPGEIASHTWEDRFGLEAYMPLITQAAEAALKEAGIDQADHVVISCSQARAAAATAKKFPAKIEGSDPNIGYAGAADAGLKLAAVLDRARPGETILVISAVDGADATIFKTTDAIEKGRAAKSVASQIEGGRDMLYATYLSWRGILEREAPRRPEPDRPAGPPSARSEAWKFGFVGVKCQNCGRITVPPTRTCTGCGAIDQMDRAPLAGKQGTVATFTVDRLAYSPSPPLIDVVVDFDDGGRYTLEMADSGPDEVEIGTRVEMTFRRLYTTGGVHNYFWKARPASTESPQAETKE